MLENKVPFSLGTESLTNKCPTVTWKIEFVKMKFNIQLRRFLSKVLKEQQPALEKREKQA